MSLNPGWIASDIVSIVFAILYPLLLAIVVNRRLGVRWKYFAIGMLIFLLFQLISRVPIVIALGPVVGPRLTSPFLLYSWVFILALTAGLFEEVGRYVAYRWIMRREEKTWNKAVMYGLGHGGLESILLVGG